MSDEQTDGDLSLAGKVATIAELESAIDLMKIECEKLKKAQIPPELQAMLDEIDAEHAGKISLFAEMLADLKKEVTLAIINAGRSLKAGRMQVVYNKGRVTWNNKKLEAFGERHPELIDELLAARSLGDEYCTFRHIGEQEQ